MTAPLGQIHGNILIMKQKQIPRSYSNNCTNALACAAAGVDGLCHSMTCGGNDWEPLSGEMTAGASQTVACKLERVHCFIHGSGQASRREVNQKHLVAVTTARLILITVTFLGI